MAKDAKGTTPVVEAGKKAETVKEAAVKPAEQKKEEAKKAEPKKVDVANPVPKKETAPVRKTAAKTKKAVKDKAPMVPEVFVQFDDALAGAQEASVSNIVAKIKAIYVGQGHRESSIKSLQIYMKPQEWKVYYVINNKIQGDIELF